MRQPIQQVQVNQGVHYVALELAVPETEQEAINGNTEDEGDRLEEGFQDRRLGNINLRYHRQSRLLECLQCHSVLGTAFDQHLRTKHSIGVSLANEEFVRSLCFRPDMAISVYRTPTMQLLPPVSFLPVKDGFRCPSCAYYTTTSKSMKKHLAGSHRGEVLIQRSCKVQTLVNSSYKSFFGVQTEALPAASIQPLAGNRSRSLREKSDGVLK